MLRYPSALIDVNEEAANFHYRPPVFLMETRVTRSHVQQSYTRARTKHT